MATAADVPNWSPRATHRAPRQWAGTGGNTGRDWCSWGIVGAVRPQKTSPQPESASRDAASRGHKPRAGYQRLAIMVYVRFDDWQLTNVPSHLRHVQEDRKRGGGGGGGRRLVGIGSCEPAGEVSLPGRIGGVGSETPARMEVPERCPAQLLLIKCVEGLLPRCVDV